MTDVKINHGNSDFKVIKRQGQITVLYKLFLRIKIYNKIGKNKQNKPSTKLMLA